MKRGNIWYFGGGFVAHLNDVVVPANSLDADDAGADPVIFDEPGGGEAARHFREAEVEALLDPTFD